MPPIIIWAGLGLLAYFGLSVGISGKAGRSKPPDTSTASKEAGLKAVASDYSVEDAKTVEKIFRLETKNFISGGWFDTAMCGMGAVAGKNEFPFGWSSLKDFPFKDLEKETFLTNKIDSGNGLKQIGFSSVELSMRYFAWFIKTHRDGNYGKWHVMDQDGADKYMTRVNMERTPICDRILKTV